ncbi:MAG: glycosyltransferase family 4 protein [Alphaproteobacteria bacterium]|jgi:glycosyltransferase involved in cell wall biosynthesis|nr:glycosyltransferase family 4 protein [Alphaproteobacteria bacterium]
MSEKTNSAILFLDGDSGRGGASRSLSFMAQELKNNGYDPVIIVQPANPLIETYRELGIEFAVVPQLPTFRPAERKIWFAFLRFLWRMRRARSLRKAIYAIAEKHRVIAVHANHENISLFGMIVAKWLAVPLICHIRTQLVPTSWAGWLYRRIAARADAIICIADPVRSHFEALAGIAAESLPLYIVHNFATGRERANSDAEVARLDTREGAISVISLSNFSPNRGVDQIVDVALSLRKLGQENFLFLLCGKPANTKGGSGKQDPYYENLRQRVRDCQLEDMIHFPGYVTRPIDALAQCDVLIRLTRLMPSPWGRDIIEAMLSGLPIVTLGEYEGFVSNGVNGFVERSFSADTIAAHLIALRDQPELRQRMGQASLERVNLLFNPKANCAKLAAIYTSLAGDKA